MKYAFKLTDNRQSEISLNIIQTICQYIYSYSEMAKKRFKKMD